MLRLRTRIVAVAAVASSCVVLSALTVAPSGATTSVRGDRAHAALAASSCRPTVSSAGPVVPGRAQDIVIRGSCFGTSHPFVGTSEHLLFTYLGGPYQWSACSTGSSVTCDVTSWTSTSITIAGFSGAYGQHGWTVAPGAEVLFSVWNAQTGQGPATAGVRAGAGPPASSVVVPVGADAPAGCYPKLDAQRQPYYVAIIVGGIGSYTAGGSYDPLDFAYHSKTMKVTDYCISHHGTGAWQVPAAPKSVRAALTYFIPHPEVQTSLTNSLANAGAVVLPFSYLGATLGTYAGQPWLVVNTSSTSQPGDVQPLYAASELQREVSSVRATWPDARIVVVAHSEGGLVAETWWSEHGTAEMSSGGGAAGVVGVFSMDSPINGLPTGGTCGLEKGIVSVLSARLRAILGLPDVKTSVSTICQLAHVGAALGDYYAKLWRDAGTRDPEITAVTASEHNLYVPIGSEYDPVYYLLGDEGGPDHNGLATQVLYHWKGGEPLGSDLAPSYLTSCYAGTGVTFTMLRDAALISPAFDLLPELEQIANNFTNAHGVVINCPSTIVYVLHRLLGDDGGWFAALSPPVTTTTLPAAGVTGPPSGLGSAEVVRELRQLSLRVHPGRSGQSGQVPGDAVDGLLIAGFPRAAVSLIRWSVSKQPGPTSSGRPDRAVFRSGGHTTA